jgi:anti-sigma factor RsiW
MSALRCAHSDEVRELLMRGQWPVGCSAELRAHVDGCGRCAELVLVMGALRGARENSLQVSRMASSPSLIWWRAQLRRRREAMETVGRGLRGAQVFALVVALCVVLGCVWRGIRAAGSWSLIESTGPGALFRYALNSLGMVPLIACAGMLVLMGGVVVYLTLQRE